MRWNAIPPAVIPVPPTMQAELDDLGQVKVTGRCDRVKGVAPWKRILRQHAAVILAFAVPVVVPGALALWLLLRHHNLH